MKFIFYTGSYFELWDYRNPDTVGIGGSETSQIEMAQRLAKRGHTVISYAPIKADCERFYNGVEWRSSLNVDWNEDGLWVIYRTPNAIDNFKVKPQQVWLMCQDTWYPTSTKDNLSKYDRILTLCNEHTKYTLENYPYLEGKIFQVANGVKSDLIREIEKEGVPERNYKRLMYASSPDRGLKSLIKIFSRAREIVSDLELHIFYGFDNIDKLSNSYYKKLKKEIGELIENPGIVWHGRIPQKELYKEWFKSGIWCYPTNFTETGCITSMEAMACGAIPLTNPIWALRDNIRHGILVEGDAYNDKLVQARYVGEIVRLASDKKLQDDIRKDMMFESLFLFNWERQVDIWEGYINGFNNRCVMAQYNYQLKNVKGKILNVGCNIDIAKFRELNGAVNLDYVDYDENLKVKLPVDVKCDARNMPEELYGKFDTVILGDILEHFEDTDVELILEQSKKCLNENGIIIITCPNDERNLNLNYTYGNHFPVSMNRISKWIIDCNLKVKNFQEIDYGMCMGYGYVVQ